MINEKNQNKKTRIELKNSESLDIHKNPLENKTFVKQVLELLNKEYSEYKQFLISRTDIVKRTEDDCVKSFNKNQLLSQL